MDSTLAFAISPPAPPPGALCAAPAGGPDRLAGAASGDLAAACAVRREVSHDVDAQAAGLRQWQQVYAQLTPGPFEGTLHELCLPGVQVFREATSQAVHEAGRPWPGRRAYGVPECVPRPALFCGEALHAGTLAVLGGELDFCAPAGFAILGLALEESQLQEHASRIEHADAATLLAGSGTRAAPAQPLDALRRLLASVLAAADATPAALAHPHAQRLLTQSLCAALFAVAPRTDASLARSVPPGRRRQVVAQAKRYMEAHIDEPISVADLCLELRVSRRTLQYSFNDALGLNAVAFLRAMRLNGVRRALKAGGATVQDAAARWGFWHLGHFVTDYRRMFGELPSHTLRGARAPAAEGDAKERG